MSQIKMLFFILVITSINCIPYHTRMFNTVNGAPVFNGWWIDCRVDAFREWSGIKQNNLHQYKFYAFMSLSTNEYKAPLNKTDYYSRINAMTLETEEKKYTGKNLSKTFDTTGYVDMEYDSSSCGCNEKKVFIPKKIETVMVKIDCSFKHKITNEVIDTLFTLPLKRYEKTHWGLLME